MPGIAPTIVVIPASEKHTTDAEVLVDTGLRTLCNFIWRQWVIHERTCG